MSSGRSGNTKQDPIETTQPPTLGCQHFDCNCRHTHGGAGGRKWLVGLLQLLPWSAQVCFHLEVGWAIYNFTFAAYFRRDCCCGHKLAGGSRGKRLLSRSRSPGTGRCFIFSCSYVGPATTAKIGSNEKGSTQTSNLQPNQRGNQRGKHTRTQQTAPCRVWRRVGTETTTLVGLLFRYRWASKVMTR